MRPEAAPAFLRKVVLHFPRAAVIRAMVADLLALDTLRRGRASGRKGGAR